jgi:hypothetical protein
MLLLIMMMKMITTFIRTIDDDEYRMEATPVAPELLLCPHMLLSHRGLQLTQ